MESYSLVYIDDRIEPSLSEYLSKGFSGLDFEVNCEEIEFIPEKGYESLLHNTKVITANVILIDSRLFENKTASAGKFSGEEFKIVLKKLYPFIEVIVITQNENDSGVEKISKFNTAIASSAFEYYDHVLPPQLEKAVKSIRQYRVLANMVNRNDSWDVVLKENLIATLDGKSAYDDLTKSDIDELISAFKQIQERLDD